MHGVTSTGLVLDERIEVINDDSRLRLTRGPDVVLDVEMTLYAPGATPHATGLSISVMPRTSTKNARAAACSPRGIASGT